MRPSLNDNGKALSLNKSQITNYKYQINAKYQAPNEHLDFWLMDIIYFLMLGIWCFIKRQIRPNCHGDVTGLADSSGSVVSTYSYDEFGNLTSSTGNVYNPLRYSGANNAYYDSETSMYKMGCRYYMPEVGRWLTRDSYKGEQESSQSQNRHVYCKNNPITEIDITGFWSAAAHAHQTKTIAQNKIHFSPYISTKLGDRAGEVDYKYDPATRPSVHFNTWSTKVNAFRSWCPWKYKKFIGGDVRVYNAAIELETAIVKWKANDRDAAIKDIGLALHRVQDVYAHMEYTRAQHLTSPYKDLLDYPNASYKKTIGMKNNGCHSSPITKNLPWNRWRFPRMQRATRAFLMEFSKGINK
ncbi:MAG: hypothetical protein C4562_02375 [Actinobacteria bacterium]|nr:MAG: hypothetical protein C4562_02375 [Actinomycetota bacterium]